ncbi:DUF2837 family protein [Janthinobacterium sp. Ant5-2-1]|uniref:DUF2837 family protein n=1 Tax=Janthinobacterium sp. Ant5-2-1 TaxID=1755239 RepID=UPI001F358FAE
MVWLVGSRLLGTVIALFLLVPAAVVIVGGRQKYKCKNLTYNSKPIFYCKLQANNLIFSHRATMSNRAT